MTSDRFVGLFIFHGSMSVESCLTMLEKKVWSVFSVWDEIEDLVLMQGGKPLPFVLLFFKNE